MTLVGKRVGTRDRTTDPWRTRLVLQENWEGSKLWMLLLNEENGEMSMWYPGITQDKVGLDTRLDSLPDGEPFR